MCFTVTQIPDEFNTEYTQEIILNSQYILCAKDDPLGAQILMHDGTIIHCKESFEELKAILLQGSH